MRPGTLLAALAVACLAAATAAAGHRRPQAYPHLEGDWQQLRQSCEAREGRCAGLQEAELENCVRR